jgi:amino acid permease
MIFDFVRSKNLILLSILNSIKKETIMKKSILFTVFATIILLVTFSHFSYPTFGNPTKSGAETAFPAGQTLTTVTVTVTAIDLAANKVTLKDQTGKIYVFVVDPQMIDLKRIKVGDTFTATISTTVTTDKVTRARISKTQLIKLQ